MDLSLIHCHFFAAIQNQFLFKVIVCKTVFFYRKLCSKVLKEASLFLAWNQVQKKLQT